MFQSRGTCDLSPRVSKPSLRLRKTSNEQNAAFTQQCLFVLTVIKITTETVFSCPKGLHVKCDDL